MRPRICRPTRIREPTSVVECRATSPHTPAPTIGAATTRQCAFDSYQGSCDPTQWLAEKTHRLCIKTAGGGARTPQHAGKKRRSCSRHAKHTARSAALGIAKYRISASCMHSSPGRQVRSIAGLRRWRGGAATISLGTGLVRRGTVVGLIKSRPLEDDAAAGAEQTLQFTTASIDATERKFGVVHALKHLTAVAAFLTFVIVVRHGSAAM